MEAIRKQASKFREQVAKQQQALMIKLGHFGTEPLLADEAEIQCHQQLHNLYNSTRTAKHFQKNIVRGIEGFISLSTKQMAIVRRLADDCSKYGANNQNSCPPLATAVLNFSTSHSSIEDKREALLGILGDQVCDPLRAQITGAPLEDARHLTHRYDKLRQEVEIQVILYLKYKFKCMVAKDLVVNRIHSFQAAEVLRRRAKSRDSSISAESATRLENAEARLSELKSTMMALGREATTAMQSVEAQQQQVTYERLRTMVDAERSYHQHALTNLERLNYELIQLAQSDGSLSTAALVTDTNTVPTIRNGEESDQPSEYKKTTSKKSDARGPLDENKDYIIAKVIHPFDAQADGELSLSIDDYVMLRQVVLNVIKVSSTILKSLFRCGLTDGLRENAKEKQVGFPLHMSRSKKTYRWAIYAKYNPLLDLYLTLNPHKVSMIIAFAIMYHAAASVRL
ncbi:SH3 domain-containing protein 1 isoform X1 [Cucumis melo var. makuwa]|uniref:SH3 domain-containing protein 1 isoform X1 n=1 Tax=Cucumis melo var. makuwa TaxID=1194695 RepID=A0A5A7U955_CUCMM|nr:SH3 domain-containing protein 1 isoform X1 [Cucumis melo var. makuwa]